MRCRRYVSAFINFYVKNASIFDIIVAVNQKREQKVNLVLIHNKVKMGNTKNTTRRKRSRVRHTITTAPRKPTTDDRPIDEGRTEKKKNKMKNKLLFNLIEQYLQHRKILEIFKDEDKTDEGKVFLTNHSLRANALFWVLYSTYSNKTNDKISEFKARKGR